MLNKGQKRKTAVLSLQFFVLLSLNRSYKSAKMQENKIEIAKIKLKIA